MFIINIYFDIFAEIYFLLDSLDVQKKADKKAIISKPLQCKKEIQICERKTLQRARQTPGEKYKLILYIALFGKDKKYIKICFRISIVYFLLM